MLRDTTTRNTLSKITCTRFPERSLQDSCFDARDRHDDRVTRRTVRSRSFRSFDVGRPRIGRGIIHLESEVERSEPITTPFSSFTISRCVQKDVEEKGEGESDDEERKDEGSGLGLILSLSSLLVPSIEPDKGKRRLAFSSTLSTLAVSFVLSLSLSPSLAFLSVLPHLGRGPSTVCDPRPTFSSSIRTAYHHYHRVSSHLLQPRAATFYFFIFFFLNFYYYYYYYFFFFFFLFFAVVVVTAVVVVIIDAVSFFNSVSSSSSCFSSLIPLQTHVVVSATPIDAPTTDPRPPAFPELFSRAAPIRPRRISGTEERTLDKRKLDGPVRSRAVSR